MHIMTSVHVLLVIFEVVCLLKWTHVLSCTRKRRNPSVDQFCVFFLSAKLSLDKRTNVALAGKTVVLDLEVTVPANSTKSNITCYRNNHKVWTHSIDDVSPNPQRKKMSATITMHNSSCSGEYYFKYINEKVYWVVLVRGEWAGM